MAAPSTYYAYGSHPTLDIVHAANTTHILMDSMEWGGARDEELFMAADTRAVNRALMSNPILTGTYSGSVLSFGGIITTNPGDDILLADVPGFRSGGYFGFAGDTGVFIFKDMKISSTLR